MTGRSAHVSAGHDEAARIAATVLESGGNAIDAGVAATIALCVLHSEQVQLGGIAPMLVRLARDGTTHAIEGVGRWPLAIDPGDFDATHRGRIPHGVLRSIVPAAPDAWITALLRFGSMGFAELATPAFELAGTGFAAHADLVSCTTQFERYYRRYDENMRIWLPHGRPLAPGERFVQPELAATLALLIEADRGGAPRGGRAAGLAAVHDLFYRGAIAERIVAHVQGLGGRLTSTDLARHRTPVVDATRAEVCGGTLCSFGFWSQGPALAQALQILEAAGAGTLDPSGSAFAHLVIEALELALADREAHYGDAVAEAEPRERLLERSYAALRARSIDADAAFAGLPPAGGAPARSTTIRNAPDATTQTTVDTSIVAVIDADGNAFVATPSDPSFDAPAVPGLGFVVSTRGAQGFVDRAHPAALGPERRPRITACPMLFEGADGRLLFGGGPGGDFQLQAMAQVLARHLLCGEALEAAVHAPRVFTQSAPASSDPHLAFPGRVLVEDGASPDVLEGLTRRGHQAMPDRLQGSTRPSICLVATDGAGGSSVGDPRREGGQRTITADGPRGSR